jgi:hypothetical protein
LKHENYDFQDTTNDVALITLEKDVVFNDKIQPACLPPKDFSYPKVTDQKNEKGFIAGWGRTIGNDSNAGAVLLQNIAVNITTSEYCQCFHTLLENQNFTADSKVCLGKYY